MLDNEDATPTEDAGPGSRGDNTAPSGLVGSPLITSPPAHAHAYRPSSKPHTEMSPESAQSSRLPASEELYNVAQDPGNAAAGWNENGPALVALQMVT